VISLLNVDVMQCGDDIVSVTLWEASYIVRNDNCK